MRLVSLSYEGGGSVNFGPFIFLGAFITLLMSWSALIVAPQVQLKSLDQVKDETTGVFKPSQPLGAARQGADVYRSNGCNYCHSQQIQQTGYTFDVVLDQAGDFPDVFAKALMKVNPVWEDFEAEMMAMDEGGVLFADVDLYRRNAIQKKMDAEKVADLGVKLSYVFKPSGTDISRGWGARGSVAADYLFAEPAMIGSSRVGPDLANVGSRLPDEQWHYNHLYAPRTMVDGSTMPAYRYLFEKRAIGNEPSPNALMLESEHAAEDGYEMVPTREAELLVAYLKSLRITDSLPEAPLQTQ